MRFGESYTSLILGIVVVIVSTILLLSFVNNKNANKNKKQDVPVAKVANSSPTANPTASVSAVAKKSTPTLTPAKATSTPTPAKVAKEVVKGEVYVVKKGDSLWTIAEKIYKSGYNWVDIARVNKLSNPDAIEAGSKLVLPKVEQKVVAKATVTTADEQYNKTSRKVEQDKSAMKQAPVQGQKITGTTYTVVLGDTLWDISVRAYGDGYQWVKIAEANNLANPSIIHRGNTFKIPRGK